MVNCWVFDGVNDYLSAPTSASIETPTTELTLWAWHKPAGVESGDYSAIIHKNWITGGGNPYESYSIGTYSGEPLEVRGGIGNGTSFLNSNNTYRMNNQTWYFLVLTYLNNNARFRVYSADGTKVHDVNKSLTGPIAYNTGDLRIGRSEGNAHNGGKIAYAGAHDAVFSDVEIDLLRATGEPPVTPSAFFLPLQDPTPTDTAQGNTFTVFGGAFADDTDGPPVTPPGSAAPPPVWLRTPSGGYLRTASGVLRSPTPVE